VRICTIISSISFLSLEITIMVASSIIKILFLRNVFMNKS